MPADRAALAMPGLARLHNIGRLKRTGRPFDIQGPVRRFTDHAPLKNAAVEGRFSFHQDSFFRRIHLKRVGSAWSALDKRDRGD